MPSNKAELEARLAAVHPGDSVRGLFFKSVLSLVQQQAGLTALETVRQGRWARRTPTCSRTRRGTS
ncbi:TIGR02265 family protein [Myxococcus sp. MxC21-1]|uniref:TIGR02265 family protein n=1 Tax=Myxococcus sp. MxC21-1 TaxID=3041439 RepID=UPI0029314EB0|nr:TIGR02265 family protein [Myxococcus sp. MxC21-1]WNZ62632.1 TIGR02265 family protein [Myxococcus sp. MxC21-1]